MAKYKIEKILMWTNKALDKLDQEDEKVTELSYEEQQLKVALLNVLDILEEYQFM